MNPSDIIKATKVGTQEEAETVDYLVCAPVSYYDDDVMGACVSCGMAIVWRFHAPKKPKRICLKCFIVMAKGVAPEEIMITPSTAKELKL